MLLLQIQHQQLKPKKLRQAVAQVSLCIMARIVPGQRNTSKEDSLTQSH
jgi:hypothetical protein